MGAEITIGTVGPADAAPAIELLAQQLRDHRIDVSMTALSAAVHAVLADDQLGTLHLARTGGVAAGVAFVAFLWSFEHGGPAAWLEELYVLPEHRCRGIGTALMNAALVDIRARGCAGVDLEIDHEHVRAAGLYRRLGFRQLPRTRWVKTL
jgi:ribosomal protein S18 acetylase RimI-like enzyme